MPFHASSSNQITEDVCVSVDSLTDVPLCSSNSNLPHNAKILAVVAQRSQQCLLSDAVRKYNAAVNMTVPASNKHHGNVMVKICANFF
jgi:hypothetical protein